jgi:hypothetical protein
MKPPTNDVRLPHGISNRPVLAAPAPTENIKQERSTMLALARGNA